MGASRRKVKAKPEDSKRGKKKKSNDGAADDVSKKGKKKKSGDGSVRQKKEKAPAKQSEPSQGGSEQVVKWVARALDMGVDKLREEFKGLAKYTLPDMTMAAFKENQPGGKNRYQDVPCQDQNRVVLKFPGCATDYVHANYVSTPQSPKRFICTQGPLDATVPEFWAMIVQEEVPIIIMLCNVIENGKNKCAQYWPEKEGEISKYDALGIEVQNMKATLLEKEPSVKKTTLKVKWKGGDREVLHYQWLDWPDRGVPPCKLTAMELLSSVRGTKQAMVVHCSAGIGRTGTIVAIEYILERFCAREECAAMNELLKMLRNQRAYSIQNDLQYLYVHRVMLCYFLEKHADKYGFMLKEGDRQAKYEQFLAEYGAATGQ